LSNEVLTVLKDKTSSLSVFVVTASIVFAFISYESSKESRRRKIMSSSASLAYEGWIEMDKRVARHPLLRRYWLEIIGIGSNPIYLYELKKDDIEEEVQIKILMIDAMIQIAENIFIVEDLRSNMESMDIKGGWVNSFIKMFRNPEFMAVFEFTRTNYTKNFQLFVYESLLNSKLPDRKPPNILKVIFNDYDTEIVSGYYSGNLDHKILTQSEYLKIIKDNMNRYPSIDPTTLAHNREHERNIPENEKPWYTRLF
jgi:hypothetical protein